MIENGDLAGTGNLFEKLFALTVILSPYLLIIGKRLVSRRTVVELEAGRIEGHRILLPSNILH